MSPSRIAFRPASVTRSDELSAARRAMAARRPFDTIPGRTAREWFKVGSQLAQASTPRELRPHPHLKNGRGKPLMVSVVTGRPTFRNRIDAEGNLV